MTPDGIEKFVNLLEDWIDDKIRDAQRDPGESSCGGTFNAYKRKNELIELLTSFLPPRSENP